MPSIKILENKKKIVAGLVEELKSAKTLIVVDYRGLTVQEDTQLRSDLRGEDVTYKVAKNTLLTLAAKEAGMEALVPHFVGPTAIAYSTTDVIAPAKVLQKYADKIKVFNIKGGVMEGDALDVAQIKALASIPPKEVLYGQVVSGIAAPITGLAIILKAIVDKGQEAGSENVSDLVAAKAEA